MRRYLLLFIFAMTMSLTAMAQSYKNHPCYMFGFGASFSDSTIYFTDIQLVDSAWVYNHDMFLYGRDQYAYQLRDYLKTTGFLYPTATVFFSLKKKDIEKKYLKLKKRYSKDGAYNIKYLSSQEFLFSAQKPDYTLLEVREEKPKKK
ncbi:MAG: hypothetical protein ACOYJG_08995 [Prevotella sp.]|jgi:hypothetical protein